VKPKTPTRRATAVVLLPRSVTGTGREPRATVFSSRETCKQDSREQHEAFASRCDLRVGRSCVEQGCAARSPPQLHAPSIRCRLCVREDLESGGTQLVVDAKAKSAIDATPREGDRPLEELDTVCRFKTRTSNQKSLSRSPARMKRVSRANDCERGRDDFSSRRRTRPSNTPPLRVNGASFRRWHCKRGACAFDLHPEGRLALDSQSGGDGSVSPLG